MNKLREMLLWILCVVGFHDYDVVGTDAERSVPVLRCRRCGKILRKCYSF